MEKITNNEYKGKTETLDSSMNGFNWFKCDTPLEKGFDEFCKNWWMKEKSTNGGWKNYSPNDEWKLLEFMKNNPIRTKQDDESFIVSNKEGKLEEKKKCKPIERPREQTAKMEKNLTIGKKLKGILRTPTEAENKSNLKTSL
nr:hypothetical protein [Tanacetum cinerariifolium]